MAGSLVVDKTKPFLLVYLHSNDEYEQAEGFETEAEARAMMDSEDPTIVLYQQIARKVNEVHIIQVAAPPAAGSADRG
jgi:hypothetical protein